MRQQGSAFREALGGDALEVAGVRAAASGRARDFVQAPRPDSKDSVVLSGVVMSSKNTPRPCVPQSLA